MKIRKYFDEGVDAEWYWGLAYYDYMRRRIVAYIIPLNWIVWSVREIWIRLRIIPKSKLDEMLQVEYKAGWDDGYKYAKSERK